MYAVTRSKRGPVGSIVIGAVVGLSIFLVLPARAAYAEPHFTLTATPQFQTVNFGKSARVTLSQKNIGLQNERMFQANKGPTHAEYDCTVRIQDQNGQIPNLTEKGAIIYGKNPRYIQTVDRVVVDIPAGAARVEDLPVGEIYDLLPQHSYSLSVTYKPMLTRMSIPLTSNRVTINVR